MRISHAPFVSPPLGAHRQYTSPYAKARAPLVCVSPPPHHVTTNRAPSGHFGGRPKARDVRKDRGGATPLAWVLASKRGVPPTSQTGRGAAPTGWGRRSPGKQAGGSHGSGGGARALGGGRRRSAIRHRVYPGPRGTTPECGVTGDRGGPQRRDDHWVASEMELKLKKKHRKGDPGRGKG